MNPYISAPKNPLYFSLFIFSISVRNCFKAAFCVSFPCNNYRLHCAIRLCKMRESGVRYFLCILWINIILTPSPFGMRAITKTACAA